MRITALTIILALQFLRLQAQTISEWHAFRGGGGGAYIEIIKKFDNTTALWFEANSDSVLMDSSAFLFITPIPQPYNTWQSEQAYFVTLDTALKPLIQLQFSAGKSIHTHSAEVTESGDYLLTYMIYDDTVYLNNSIFIADTTLKKSALCITKVRPDGNIAFNRYFKGSASSAHIDYLSGGKIVLAGQVSYQDIIFDSDTLHCLGCHVEDTDIFVAVLDSMGHTLKAKRFGSPLYDYCNDLIITQDDDVYITGSTYGDFSLDTFFLENYLSWLNSDAYLLKMDADLNPMWLKQAGSTDLESGRILAQDNEGNIYWGCQFWGNTVFVEGDTLLGNNTNSFIAKINDEGQVVWKKVFASEGPLQHISSLTTDASNNIWATMGYYVSLVFDDVSLPGGPVSTSGIRSDATLIQIDQNGDVMQYYIANSVASDFFSRVQSLPDNQLFVSGSAGFDDGDSLQFLNMTLHDWQDFSEPSFYFILNLSPVSTETPFDEQVGVVLMPNPVQKGALIRVRTDREIQDGRMLLYDNLGHLIRSDHISGGSKQFIFQAPYQTGVYYLCIQTDGQYYTRKVVVGE